MPRRCTLSSSFALFAITFGIDRGIERELERVAARVGLERAPLLGARGLASAQPAEAPDPAVPVAKPAPAKRARRKPAPVVREPAVPGEGREAEVPVDPYAGPAPVGDAAPTVTVPPRLGLGDQAAMQGLLAVQRLDGWLLQDRDGANPIALRLVAPLFRPQHAWYYLLPVRGEPVAVCDLADVAAFERVAGKKVTYQSERELRQALRAILKGRKSVAMEVAPNPDMPQASTVDAGTRALLRTLKIAVVSSDQLVQYTTAVWGAAGRIAHHVAVHHLVELRKDALVFLAKQLRAGLEVTEYDLQQRILRGMAMRGVVGPAPMVSAGANTADPSYRPTAETAAAIHEGDVVVLGLAMKVDKPDGVFAAQTWVAYAGATVPERVAKLFDTVTLARDQAIALIAERTRKRRPLRGHEVDRLVRGVLTKAGAGDHVQPRTGHSIDTLLDGTGADLDDERRDPRSLVAGTGVTLGPAVYVPGELGVRSEVTLFLSPSGPEVTTPAQQRVDALLAP